MSWRQIALLFRRFNQVMDIFFGYGLLSSIHLYILAERNNFIAGADFVQIQGALSDNRMHDLYRDKRLTPTFGSKQLLIGSHWRHIWPQ